jgi:Zn-dependent alcohol dehydrogenase
MSPNRRCRPRDAFAGQSVGVSAGKNISLPGPVLRSTDLTLLGSGFGSVSIDRIMSAIPEFFSLAAQGHLSAAVELIPLNKVEEAWNAVEKGKGIVFSIETR